MPILVQIALPITDPVFIFALVMLIILVAPILFARLKIPGIVGLIFAGLIVGPNATGLLERDQTIELLGTVGLLYIMFVAGLEINLAQFARYRNRSVLFGSLTFLLPQVIGTVLAVYVFGFAWGAAILVASMFASHTLLAYPTASRLEIAKSEPVTTAVGGTIITDTIALMVLVVIAGSVEGTLNAAFWSRLGIALVIFVALVFWVLPRIGRWFFRRLRAESAEEYVFVLAAVFLSALLSEFAGMEPIIGAFMAGLALNRLIPEQSVLMNRIHFVGDALFIPFFLLSVGMLVDLEIFIAGIDAWTIAGFMIVTVFATKWLAAMATGRLLRYSTEESMVVFGLSVAQAAATLAVVIVGYDLGVFGDAVLNGAIAMIFVTCVASPWIVERYGRRMALAQARKPYSPDDAPQRILVPLANPATAASLIDLALMIRRPEENEPIFPLTVVRDGAAADAEVAAGEKLLAHAVAHGTAAEVPIHPVTRIDMNPADGIIRAIRERRISEVVIGWNGEVSASERIFGTVVDQLLAETRAQVLVCKCDSPVNTIDRVILTIPPYANREPGFTSAVRDIKVLAHQIGAELIVVASSAYSATLSSSVTRVRPEVPTRTVTLSRWADLIDSLDELVQDHDLVVAISAREGTISWRPMLNLLPRSIARRIPSADFVIVYPSELKYEVIDGLPHSDREGLLDMLEPKHVTISYDEREGDALVEEMLRGYFGEQAAFVQQTQEHLTKTSGEYRPELQKGVIFYHGVLEAIRDPVLLVGICPDGARFSFSSGPVYVVLLVLNPADARPSSHLQVLSNIARIVRDGTAIQELRKARSESDVLAFLRRSAKAPA